MACSTHRRGGRHAARRQLGAPRRRALYRLDHRRLPTRGAPGSRRRDRRAPGAPGRARVPRLIPRSGDERDAPPADTNSVSARRSRRLAVAAVGLVFLILVGSAGAHSSSLKFTALARRWVQRDLITVAVSVRPSGVVCQLSVRYADGQYQPKLAPVGAADGL